MNEKKLIWHRETENGCSKNNAPIILVFLFSLASFTVGNAAGPCPPDQYKHGEACTSRCPVYILGRECVLKCPEGHYLNTTFSPSLPSECFQCPPGKFRDGETEEESCKICPKGTFSSNNGSNACENCNEGHFQDHIQSVLCKPCPAGSHAELDERSKICILCGAGYYQSESGQGACNPCSPGRFQDEQGAKSCKKCETNMYQDEEGSTECNPCPDEKDEDLVPAQCRWKECPRGYRYKTTRNITECEICPKGTYQPDEDGTECIVCPRGYYSNRRGSERCKQCPDNAWTPTTGMKSFYDCTGPSIQLFNDREHQDNYVVAYGNQNPAVLPPDFQLEFKYARILSGKWKIEGIPGDQEEGSVVDTENTFVIADLIPIINNIFCYFPLDKPKFGGKINKTFSGEYCGRWDQSSDSSDNWCTTEDQKSSYSAPGTGPWCLDPTSRDPVSCGVPVCGWDTTCISTTDGRGYRGRKQTTKLGYHCRNWKANWPHPNNAYDNEADYGVGDHDFCRNPEREPSYPAIFCYTTNWLKRFDDCNVPICTEKDHPRYLYD